MADIRINALATTAASTASDDFVAVDGSANGTRKLNAFSPTFGGNATVGGNLTVSGTGNNIFNSGGGNVGIGTSSPGALLDVNTVSSATTGLIVQASGVTSSQINMGIGVVTAGRPFIGTNTNANPLEIGTRASAALVLLTDTTERMRITSTGNLLIGGTTDITGSGGLKVFGTTAASSTTSGALQVAGGVGVAGAGYFGGTIVNSHTSSLVNNISTSNLSATGYGIFSRAGSTLASGYYLAQFINFDGTVAGLRVYSDVVQIPATTASTSTSSGALVVSGGVGVAGAANVGTYYGMVDGVTAPGTTAGYAKIYVDTADGDLKVKFGDGTIKTIATDT